jgi:hypothetical protein
VHTLDKPNCYWSTYRSYVDSHNTVLLEGATHEPLKEFVRKCQRYRIIYDFTYTLYSFLKSVTPSPTCFHGASSSFTNDGWEGLHEKEWSILKFPIQRAEGTRNDLDEKFA